MVLFRFAERKSYAFPRCFNKFIGGYAAIRLGGAAAEG